MASELRPRCPYCGYEGDITSFKLLRDTWKYNFYTVYRLQCPKCNGIFHYYVGISPKGKKSSFTIKMRPRPSKKKQQ